MFSFVKNLFTTSKSADAVIDGAIRGIDAAFFTEEEQAENRKEIQKLWLQGIELDRNASNIRSVTRRWIAILTFSHYFLWIDAAMVASALGKTAFATYAWNVVLEVFWLVFAVGSYYFGPMIAERAVGLVKKGSK